MKKYIFITLAFLTVAFFGLIGKDVARRAVDRSEPRSLVPMLTEITEELNATLPKQIDENTRMDTSTVGPGKKLTYFYTILDTASIKLTSVEFSEALRPQLIDSYRTNPKMFELRENDFTVCFCYRDESGTIFANIEITPSDF
jgi:hypothetical protein